MKKLTLDIDQKTWNEFKSGVTKDKTLNDALVDLIIKENKLNKKNKK